MNGMTIAQSLGGISDELLAEALSEPKRPRKRKFISLSVAAVLVAAVALGLYFGGIIPVRSGGDQCGPLKPEKEVYEIVMLENTAPNGALYVCSVAPGEDVIAAVKEKFYVDFEEPIFVFEDEGWNYKKEARYLFPLIRDGEVRLVVDVRVTKKGVYMSYTHHLNDLLNTVSGLTSAENPGYIVTSNETVFCVIGDKAYCTECIWDDLEYIGEIEMPKKEVSVVQVN